MSQNKAENTNVAIKAGFTSMLVLMLIFGIFSLYQLRNITQDMTNVIATNSKKLIQVVLMRDTVRQRQVIMSEMMSEKNAFERDKSRLVFFNLSGVFRKEKDKLLELHINDSEKKLLDKILNHILVVQPLNREAVDVLVTDNTSGEGRDLISRAQVSQKYIYALLGDLINLQDENTQKYVQTSREKYSTTLFLSVLFGIIISLIAWVIARVTEKIITLKNEELVIKNNELEKASSQALEATRTKSEFLAVISHEIRTPLTSIIGFAEVLSDGSTKAKDRISITKTIIKNGTHLLDLINDILDVSKIEANKMDFEKITFSPIELIREIEESIKHQFVEKGLQFYLEYAFPLPSTICNDPFRTKQIILNLCSNALKFTKYGKVCVKTHSDIENEKLFVTVIDSGIGLTSEQTDKIFDAFTQADSSISRKYGGTGLGLSLSKKFAENMGGTVTVKSLPGIGSEFCMSIDTGKIDSQKLIMSENELLERTSNTKITCDYSSHVRGNILIAEDNHDNQQLISILLSDIGAEITFVENGQQAIDAALSRNYDLIFMDMQMPIMGGVEATKKLRKLNYTKPIIALTANAMRTDHDMCIEAGCDDFLTKPIHKDELFQAVYENLEIISEKVKSNHIVSDVYDRSNIKMQELIIKFVEGLSERISDITAFRNDNDWESMKDELHKIKGIGSSMGYPMITKIAGDLEYEVIRKNTIEVDKLLLEMKNVCDRIIQNFSNLNFEHKE